MSQVIDSKVVEMRFDNKEFEANARTTINTLENLKAALNENLSGEAFTNLDRAARNVDLSSIESSLETLTDRFSTMGVVGMRVIQNLTDGLMNLVNRGINYATDAISSGGMKRAQNIENAHFQLQGLIDDETKVREIMNNALDSVNDTAYAYDEAAKAAAMFAASGIEGGEQMKGALKAIAGVAATTNSDYERMANIFTTVAGQGKLMTQQLRMLESSGMNAAASMADYFNKVREAPEEASEAVRNLVAQLSGSATIVDDVTGSISSSIDDIIEAQQKADKLEYKAKQKAFNNEYQDYKKELDAEYNLKKKAYDASYQELSKSLDAEIKAVQKANQQRLQDVNDAYQRDVEAYRNATQERIDLINEEYTESIKLIDEERYNKIKAAQDKIKSIQDEAAAEQKAERDKANEEKRAELKKMVSKAKTISAKKAAEKALAEFEEELAKEKKAEDRQNQIEELHEEINNIKDEADEKKRAAQEKRQSEVEIIQEESQEKLKEMQKAHQEEVEAIQESNNLKLEQMRENKATQLAELKESQSEELSVYREGQQAQLEAMRERQQTELEEFRDAQNEKLKAMKESHRETIHVLEDFDDEVGFTEAQIREMITNGLIDFDTFSEAMGKTFGDHAKDANKTFTGAMANIRSAFAKIGALFYSPLIQEEGPLVQLLNSIRIKVNELKNELAPFAEYITNWLNLVIIPAVTRFVDGLDVKLNANWEILRGLSNIMLFIFNTFKAIGRLFEVVGDAFKEVFQIDSSSFYETTQNLVEFSTHLMLSRDNSKKLAKFIKSLAKLFSSMFGIVKKVVGVFKPLTKLFGEAAGDTLTLGSSVADLIEKFANWLDTSEGIKKVFEVLTTAVELFVDGIIIAKDKVSDFVKNFSGLDAASNFVKGFVDGIKTNAETIYKAVVDVFTKVIESVKTIFDSDMTTSQKMISIGKTVAKGFEDGFGGYIEKAVDSVKNGFSRVVETIKNIFSSFNSDEIDMDGESLGGNFITDFISGVTDHIPSPIQAIKDFFIEMKEKVLQMKIGSKTGEEYLSQFVEGFKNAIEKGKNAVSPIFEKVTRAIHDFFINFATHDGEESGWAYVISFLKGVKDKIVDKGAEVFNTISDAIKGFFEEVPDLAILGSVVGAITTLVLVMQGIKSGAFSQLAKVLKLFRPLKGLFDGIDFLKTKENIEEFIDAIATKVAFIPENILEGFKEGLLKGNELITTVSEFFGKILQAIKDVFGIASPAKRMIEIGENIINTLVDTIVRLLGPAAETIGNAFEKLFATLSKVFTEGLSKLDGNEASMLAFVGGIGALLILLKLTKQLDTLIGPFHRVNAVFSSLGKALKAFAFDSFAEGLLKIAGAFGVFFGSLAGFFWVIDQLENGDRIAYTITAISLALVGFIVMVKLILDAVSKIKEQNLSIFSDDPKENFLIYIGQGIKKTMKQWTFAHSMKAFSESVLMIAGSFIGVVITIAKYKDNDDTIKTALIVLASMAGAILLMGAIGVLIASIVKKKELDLNGVSNDVLKLGGTILALAAGIWLIADAIKKLTDLDMIKNSKNVMAAVGAIMMILIALGGIMVLYSWLNNDTGSAIVSLSPILSFALGLLVTVMALKKLMSLDIKEEDKGKLWILFGLIVVFGIVMAAIQDTANQGSGVITGGGVILAMCVWLYAAIGAIALLSNFDPVTLIKGIAAIIFLCIAIAIPLHYASKDTGGSFKTILAMCAALATCLIALGILSTFKPESLWAPMLAIISILIMIAVVFYNMSKIETGVGSNKVWAMVAMLAVIAGGLWAITSEVTGGGNWMAILYAGIAMSAVLAVYAWSLNYIGKTKFNDDSIKKYNKGILLLAAIAGSLWLVSNGSSGGSWSSILAAGVSICGVLGVYALVFKYISDVKIKEDTIKHFLWGSLSMIVIGGALAAVAWADWGSILSAGGSISLVLEAYADVFKKMQGVDVKVKNTEMFLYGAISVIMIGGALAAVAWADWKSIAAAGASVSGAMEAYADVFKKVNAVDEVKPDHISQFLKGIVGVILIGGTIGVMAHFCNWDDLLAAAGGIALVLSKYKTVFSEISGIEVKKGAIKNYLIASIAIAMIGGVIAGTIGLANYWSNGNSDWKQLAAAAGGIALVLYVMSKVMTILAGIKDVDVLPAVGALIGASIGAILIAVALNKVENTDGAIKTAISISVVLVASAVILSIVKDIGDALIAAGMKGVGGTVLGIALLDGFLASVAATMDRIGALADTEAVKRGKDTLIMCGQAIGGFFGGIIEGFLNLTGQGIAEIGSDMSAFMKNAQPFFEALDNFDDNTLGKAQALANVVETLSVSSFITSLSNFIDAVNPFNKGMKEKFQEFGESISAFATATKDSNGWNTKNMAEAVKDLALGLKEINPLKEWFTSLGLGGFKTNLENLGAALAGLTGPNGFNGVPNPQDYKAAADSTNHILGIFKDTSHKELEGIEGKAKFLPSIGESLKTFSSSIRVISSYGSGLTDTAPFDNLKKVADIIMPLCTGNAHMSTETSLIGLTWGTNDPASLGSHFLNFVKTLCGSSDQDHNSILGVLRGVTLDVGVFESLQSITDIVFSIGEKVPTENKGWKLFTEGDNSIINFGNNFKDFIDKVAEMNKSIADAGLDVANFVHLRVVLAPLWDVLGKLKDLVMLDNGTYVNIGSQLQSLGTALENFGGNLKKFGGKALEAYPGFSGAVELLERFVALIPNLLTFDGTNVTNFFSSLKENAAEGLKNFLDAFNNSKAVVDEAIGTLFSNVGNAITSKKNLMESYGRIVIGYFAGTEGMTSETAINNCIKSINKLMREMREKASFDQMKKLGENAALGFANGLIDSAAYENLGRAAQRFSNKVVDEISKNLQIKSPSRVTAQLGMFTAEGFIEGLLSLSKAAEKAGSEIGDNAAEGLRIALSEMSENIQNEGEFNPVITPVLDLSNIEENAGAIGGILNLDKPLSLAANAGMSFSGGLNSVLGSIQASIPDGSSADVVTAINEMRSDIAEMSSAIRKMQIVMDTGELVGVLSDPIDNQMGFNSKLVSRGVRA